VHLFSVGIVETTLAQLTIKTNNLPNRTCVSYPYRGGDVDGVMVVEVVEVEVVVEGRVDYFVFFFCVEKLAPYLAVIALDLFDIILSDRLDVGLGLFIDFVIFRISITCGNAETS
jgi:hypothetical protein